MSYILGALKKAEQERRRESGMRLSDWDQDAWDEPDSPVNVGFWLIALVATGLILVVIIFGFVAYRVLDRVPQNQSVPESNSASTQMGNIYQTDAAIDLNMVDPPQAILVDDVDVSNVLANENGSIQGREQAEQEIIQPDSPGTESTELPEFSGHLYFPDSPGLSRVFANASSYRESDEVNGYIIEAIRESEVLLIKNGEEIRIDLR